MEKFAKPWQAMPTRIISLALEHAEQDTDFDQQLAFLLLDIGVESALKIYLINKKLDVEKIFFPELLKRVGDELSKDKLQIPLDEIDYFHKTRNKLYHQGDGVKPTGENLKKYAELAKTLLKVLLDVDIEKSQEQELVQTNHSPFSLAGIQKNILSLQSNSSIMVENLYPQLATRKIEAQLRYIKMEYPDVEYSEVPFTEEEWNLNRIELFTEITGRELSIKDDRFVEYIIDNPEQLHVWLVLQEISRDDWREDWEKYKSAVGFLKHEQTKDSKTENEKNEEIYKWTYGKADNVYKWVNAHIPNIVPKEPDIYGAFLDFFE